MPRTIYVAASDGFKADFGPGTYTPAFWATQAHLRGGLAGLGATPADAKYLAFSCWVGSLAYEVWGKLVRIPARTPLILDVDWFFEQGWTAKQCAALCDAVKLVAPQTILTGYHWALKPLAERLDGTMTLEEMNAWSNAHGMATYRKHLNVFPIRWPMTRDERYIELQYAGLPGLVATANQYAEQFGPDRSVALWLRDDGLSDPELDRYAKAAMTTPGVSSVILWGTGAALPRLLGACGKYRA